MIVTILAGEYMYTSGAC